MTTELTRPTTFVTGGCGFVAWALCRRLAEAGRHVVAYDDLSRGRAENLPDGTRLIRGDIRDAEGLAAALAETRPQEVVHLAAIHYLPDCAARPDETRSVNVEGTRRVLDACRVAGVRRLVFASSVAVYAQTNEPCSEAHTPLEPVEVYGASKLDGERLLERFHHETAIPTTIVRLANAVGRHETNPHVVPHILEALRTSNRVPLGNVEPRRDYIDTRDIADAIVALLESSQGHRVFNVGTGVGHSVADIIEMLGQILNRPIVVEQDAARMRPVERMVLVADISRIRAAVGWSPRVPLADTLRDLVSAYGLNADRTSDPQNSHATSTPAP